MHWKSLGWPVKVTTPSWNAKLLPSILSPIGYTKSPTIAGLTMDLQYGPWSNHGGIKQYLHGLTSYLYGRCFPAQCALTPGMIIPMDASANDKIRFGQSQGFSNIWRIFINYISNSSLLIIEEEYLYFYILDNEHRLSADGTHEVILFMCEPHVPAALDTVVSFAVLNHILLGIYLPLPWTNHLQIKTKLKPKTLSIGLKLRKFKIVMKMHSMQAPWNRVFNC